MESLIHTKRVTLYAADSSVIDDMLESEAIISYALVVSACDTAKRPHS